jgi:quercetin dioxygenase-like cupin family protein
MSIGNIEERAPQRVVRVERTPERELDWGFMQWVCSGTLFPDAQVTVGYVEMNPGAGNPRHLHPNSDEVLFLIEGSLEHSLGDEVFQMSAGSSIHIPRSVPHGAANHRTVVARMVVAYPTAQREVVLLEEGQE